MAGGYDFSGLTNPKRLIEARLAEALMGQGGGDPSGNTNLPGPSAPPPMMTQSQFMRPPTMQAPSGGGGMNPQVLAQLAKILQQRQNGGVPPPLTPMGAPNVGPQLPE